MLHDVTIVDLTEFSVGIEFGLRVRLVACEKLNQAWGANSLLIEVPGCIQNVAGTHVKAPTAQAPGIPPNRAYPQIHPRLWLP
jgi:hypothetical protein